jgi:hypothetical protein
MTLDEMRQTLQLIEAELAQTATTPRPRAWYGTTSGKGW